MRQRTAQGLQARSSLAPSALRLGAGRAAGPRAVRPAEALAREVLSSPTLESGSMLEFLDVSERYWTAMRSMKHEPHRKGPTVVRVVPDDAADEDPSPSFSSSSASGSQFDARSSGAAGASTSGAAHHDYDVVLCGGVLGMMVAAALQARGHKVCVVEKRVVQGRTQEWNISRGELQVLLDLGLLSHEELEACIVSEFNPIRSGFKGGEDIWVRDVLNLGVSPRNLIGLLKRKFLAMGGTLMENTAFKSATVRPSRGVDVEVLVGGTPTADVGDANRPNGLSASAAEVSASSRGGNGNGSSEGPRAQRRVLRARLLLDCMGHYSDIVKQMRGRAKPDGVCMVVGSCAEGFPRAKNKSADLLVTIDDANRDDMQMFWEAFPAEGGRNGSRTTYMFTYTDASPERPSFESMLDSYFEALPRYQGVPLEDLRFKRVLFGAFPCYNDGPLQPAFDRVMQIGDASAAQSPLSFGGFGSMMRHLGRLSEGISHALRKDKLSRADLAMLHPYQPSLNASWLFQRAMSLPPGAVRPPATAAAEAAGASAALATAEPQAQAPEGFPAWARLPRDQVNQILACNFAVMRVLGDRVLRPFLQDTIQLLPLSASMAAMMLRNPAAVSRVLVQVGPLTLANWFRHYFGLVAYTVGHVVLRPLLAPLAKGTDSYALARFLDALEYGSSLDYKYHPASDTEPRKRPALSSLASFDEAGQELLLLGQQAEGGGSGDASEPLLVPVAVGGAPSSVYRPGGRVRVQALPEPAQHGAGGHGHHHGSAAPGVAAVHVQHPAAHGGPISLGGH